MASLDRSAPLSSPKPAAQSAFVRLASTLYATTLFVSALLLFGLQPMFIKMILPRLGGAPAVWSVAIVFFQAALLLGYAYAHMLVRILRPLHATFVHVAVLAAVSFWLPIGIAHGFSAPPETGVLLWLFALIVASIGPPFVVVAASAPLLQSWFAATDHHQAHNPYVLYAASNLGSFAGLLAYPFVVEPLLTLREQTWLWSLGYAMLIVLVAASGLFAARGSREMVDVDALAETAPTLANRLSWITLAAIPAGLVVAVTAYITTDVAAAPFLWVVPLALYLLTFVVLFRDKPWINEATVVRLVPLAVAPLAVSMLGDAKVYWLVVIVINLVAFLLLALVCHGALYRQRPERARLTEFYLLTSLGGVCGGIFAGLIAPNAFNDIYEYPILIAAGLLAMPEVLDDRSRFLREAGPALLIAAALAVAGFIYHVRLPLAAPLMFQACLIGLVALMLLHRRTPGAILRSRADRLRRHCTVAAGGACADRNRTQLLWRPSDFRDRRSPVPPVVRWHNAPWRRAGSRSRRHAGCGAAATADIFLFWGTDLGRNRSGAFRTRWSQAGRRDRSWNRQPCVPPQGRRALGLLRDRSCG